MVRFILILFLASATHAAETAVVPPPPLDSPLVAAARTYPGVRFHEGWRDPLLVRMAEECAALLARRGTAAYWRDGHPGWSTRYADIRRTTGLKGVEVTAFSWPRAEEQPTPAIVSGLYYDWRRSPGHWRVVATPHTRYGDALAKSRTGTWFACIIVAD